MDTLTLRPATPEDTDWLDALHTRCMREHVERNYPWRPDQFRASFDPSINEVIVVDGTPVGFVSHWREPDSLRVGTIVIDPLMQGRHIGTTVLRRFLEQASRERIVVRLRVLRGNPARRLYERLGFVVEEETEHAHVMVRRP